LLLPCTLTPETSRTPSGVPAHSPSISCGEVGAGIWLSVIGLARIRPIHMQVRQNGEMIERRGRSLSLPTLRRARSVARSQLHAATGVAIIAVGIDLVAVALSLLLALPSLTCGRSWRLHGRCRGPYPCLQHCWAMSCGCTRHLNLLGNTWGFT
jgi:hypothetical protein